MVSEFVFCCVDEPFYGVDVSYEVVGFHVVGFLSALTEREVYRDVADGGRVDACRCARVWSFEESVEESSSFVVRETFTDLLGG